MSVQSFNFKQFVDRSQSFDETPLAKAISVMPTLSSGGPWIAGGAVRRTLLGEPLESDVDIFFRDPEQLEAFRTFLVSRDLALVRETAHHVHYRGDVGDGVARDYQLIRFQFYLDAAAVIDSFDFTICQFVTDGDRLIAGETALWDLARKRLVLHRLTFPVSTMRRLLKYQKQSFYACAGCLSAILAATCQSPELQTQLDTEYVD